MKQLEQDKLYPIYMGWKCPACSQGMNCTNEWEIGQIVACHRCGAEFEIVKPEEEK